jgi:type VI secretion system secreted protein Hcp
MFFKVKGAKHGPINGEAQDDKHKNEIEVLAWSWGMQGKSSIGGGSATGKATIRATPGLARCCACEAHRGH